MESGLGDRFGESQHLTPLHESIYGSASLGLNDPQDLIRGHLLKYLGCP